MPPKDVTGRRSRSQISLRWFVATTLVLGPVLGFGGPIALRMLRQITAPPPPPPIMIPASAFDDLPLDYYESGETPLD